MTAKKDKTSDAPKPNPTFEPKKKEATISANSFIRSQGLGSGWEGRLIAAAGRDNLPIAEWKRILKKIK